MKGLRSKTSLCGLFLQHFTISARHRGVTLSSYALTVWQVSDSWFIQAASNGITPHFPYIPTLPTVLGPTGGSQEASILPLFPENHPLLAPGSTVMTLQTSTVECRHHQGRCQEATEQKDRLIKRDVKHKRVYTKHRRAGPGLCFSLITHRMEGD